MVKFTAKFEVDGVLVCVYDGHFVEEDSSCALVYNYDILEGSYTYSKEELEKRIGEELMLLLEDHLEGNQ